jgi:hypothetical protein
MNAAIKPYSMALEPDSPLKRRVTMLMLSSSLNNLLTNRRGGLPLRQSDNTTRCRRPKIFGQIYAVF